MPESTQETVNQDLLSTLPQDIFNAIFGHLNRRDILNLRLSSLKLLKAVNNGYPYKPEFPVVSTGAWHTIFYDYSSVFTCGYNLYGQLGLNDNINRFKPTLIPSAVFQDKKVVRIVAGINHTMFLCEDGSVFGCGKNDIGQLGLGRNTNNQLQPMLLSNFSKRYYNYHSAITTKELLLKHAAALKLNAKDAVIADKIEKLLHNVQFYPAIPNILKQALDLLNPNAEPDSRLTFEQGKNEKPAFSPLFNAIKSKIEKQENAAPKQKLDTTVVTAGA